MNKRKIAFYSLPALALFVIAVGVALWLGRSRPEIHATETPRPAAAVEQQPALQAKEPSLPKAPPAAEKPETDVFDMPDAMRFQMADVAEAYRENMRYPKYSIPLKETDWDLLNPRPFIPRESPLKNGLSATMILDHYIVSRSRDLPVKLIIRGGQEDGNYAVDVALSLSDKGKTRPLISLNESDWNENTVTYTGTIPADKLKDAGPGEVIINAGISFANGEDEKVVTVVKLFDNAATLTDLGEPYIDGADLVIPAHLDVQTPGHYRFQANLYDESGQQPISHLNSEFELSEGSSSGLVRVHAATLRNGGDPGPYLLKDINVTKSPENPGERTGYGSSASDSFLVQGFHLNSYSEEPYENPQTKQRLEFLQRLAAGSD